MSDLEVGQVLALRIRFNNRGDIARTAHPYLIVSVDDALGVVEIAQLDSLEGKEYKALFRGNKTIFKHNPTETVIDKDSYVQLDNTLRVENFSGLSKFRRQKGKLSPGKLEEVIKAYRRYHETYRIDENKNVYMDRAEIIQLNP